jgi:hypothetical protein
MIPKVKSILRTSAMVKDFMEAGKAAAETQNTASEHQRVKDLRRRNTYSEGGGCGGET